MLPLDKIISDKAKFPLYDIDYSNDIDTDTDELDSLNIWDTELDISDLDEEGVGYVQ